MHGCSLKVEVFPWVALGLSFVLMQEHQSTIIRSGVSICESTPSTDTCHPQWFVSPCTDAVEESLLVSDILFALSVVFGGVRSEDEPSSVVGGEDSGPLFVTAVVKSSSCETVDAGFVEQVELDMTKERVQLLLLLFRQAGCDNRHDGETVQTDLRMQQITWWSF